MGQAAIDLPDPLDRARSAAATAPAADDLVAQMAGDEIERLLGAAGLTSSTASAEAVPAPVPASVTAPKASPADELPPPPAAERSANRDPNADLLPDADELPGTAASDPAAPSTQAANPDEDPALQAQLDALFDQMNAGQPTPVAAASTQPDATPAAAATATNTAAPASAEIPAAENPGASADPIGAVLNQIEPAAPTADNTIPSATATVEPATATEYDDALERALGEPVDAAPAPAASPVSVDETPVAASAPATPEPSHTATADQAAHPHVAKHSESELLDKPSLVVRVLELINSPFGNLPDGTRDLLGKVGILTFINAIAVLIYVLFFRGH